MADPEAAPKPANVIEALARVMAELPSIGKDTKGDNLPYSYRSIEDMTGAVQPLFGKYGIVFVPHVLETEVREVIINNKPWTDTVLTVNYDIYGPNSSQISVGPVIAIGRDNSDKGANKALTQAFKYALLQVLCISDSRDDGDKESHEADALPRLSAEAEEAMHDLTTSIKMFPDEAQDDIRKDLRERFGPSSQMTLEQIREAQQFVSDWPVSVEPP